MIKNLINWRNQLVFYLNSARILKLMDKIIKLEETGRSAQALIHTQQLIALYPAGTERAELSAELAHSYLKLFQYAPAAKYSQLALKDCPDSRPALRCLAITQLAASDNKTALQTINQAIRLLWREYRQEQKNVQRTTRARKDICALYTVRGEAHSQSNNYLAAVRDYRLALRESTGDKYTVNFNLGCAYCAAEQEDAAAVCFQECLRLRPGDAAAQGNYQIIQTIKKINKQIDENAKKKLA